jgi:two-component system LytT family response regulator
MSMKYVIVDDEKGSRDILAGFLKKYCPEVEMAGEADGADVAYALITAQTPDLVFLDVSMPDQNGFDLLGRFSRIDFEVIFVTAHEQYALRAIKNNAADYLLKPIGIIELKDAVSRASQRIKSKRITESVAASASSPEKITVPVRDGFIYVNLEDIVRCEAEGGYTWIHFKNKDKVLVTKTLKDFEGSLSPNQFVRVHHHHLINLKHVTKYNHGRSGQVIMTDGASIEVSQRKRGDFLQRIGVKE